MFSISRTRNRKKKSFTYCRVMYGLIFFLLVGDVPIIKLVGSYDTYQECLVKQLEVQPYLRPAGEYTECWQLAPEE